MKSVCLILLVTSFSSALGGRACAPIVVSYQVPTVNIGDPVSFSANGTNQPMFFAGQFTENDDRQGDLVFYAPKNREFHFISTRRARPLDVSGQPSDVFPRIPTMEVDQTHRRCLLYSAVLVLKRLELMRLLPDGFVKSREEELATATQVEGRGTSAYQKERLGKFLDAHHISHRWTSDLGDLRRHLTSQRPAILMLNLDPGEPEPFQFRMVRYLDEPSYDKLENLWHFDRRITVTRPLRRPVGPDLGLSHAVPGIGITAEVHGSDAQHVLALNPSSGGFYSLQMADLERSVRDESDGKGDAQAFLLLIPID